MKLGIYLPDELVYEVRSHCKDTGKTFSGMIRVGLTKQLEDSRK